MRHFTRIVTIVSFLASSISVAHAATIEVPADLPSIQEALDAAADGDVILVDEGVYFESLDFGGKDVAVRSIGGPEATVLEGTGEIGVRIGPGGEISGFTLTKSFARGLAIETMGNGSLIEGNVIEGYGPSERRVVGLLADRSSPILRRNLFRDNDCGGSHDPLLAFDTSLPVIVNNVFEGNEDCVAISLGGARFGAPVVMHNTIVGSRVGFELRTSLPLV